MPVPPQPTPVRRRIGLHPLFVAAFIAMSSCAGSDVATTVADGPSLGGGSIVAADLADAPAATVSTSVDLPGCPDAERAAVADKANQRYWLCSDGQEITDEIPMTTASGDYGLPPVGTYEVFDRDREAFGLDGETLQRFVAFYTTARGNRIAFHEVTDQDPGTIGDLDRRGASAGCFRVAEADSIRLWNHLRIGDPVVVISN